MQPTYRVSELGEEVRDLLAEAYGSVWVTGEVQRLRASARGHLYFELVEKGAGDDIVGRLDAVAWRTDHQAIRRQLAASGQALAEGMEIRCRGRLDFYPPGGRLQMAVREVDDTFSLGLLERRRRETLAALAAGGLLERNRSLPLALLPLRVGLITSHGSAAYHDFVSTLRESGYGFELLFVHAAVQGGQAEREVCDALALLAGRGVACAVLVRGGGSRSDLAAFDSARIAEAIARCPLPVLTGLGHEIDRAVADLVAHTALKTPTKVAELLVARVRESERRLAEVGRCLGDESLRLLRGGRETLGRAERGVVEAERRLEREGGRVARLGERLATLAESRLAAARRDRAAAADRLRRATPRLLARAGERPRRLADALIGSARRRQREAERRAAAIQRLVRQLGPERVLARGFSITRRSDGALVREPGAAPAGTRLVSRVAGGEIASRVEEA